MVTSYVKGRLYKLNLADLQPDPNQGLTFMDPVALAERTASVVKMGVIVPIQFRRDYLAALIIVSGHRRVAASRKAGLIEIYGTFTDGDTRLQSSMDKAAKERQPAAAKIKMSKKRTLINLLDAVGGKLDGLPLSEWSEDNRHDILNAMDGVRSKMDALRDGLNQQNPQPTEHEPGQPSRNLA